MSHALTVVRAVVRATGAIAVAALVAIAFLQAGSASNNADAIRDIVRNNRGAQVKGCQRGNVLRAQVNRNVSVLAAFIHEAVQARRATGDQPIADRYARLLPELVPLSLTNCAIAYPPVARP